MAERGVAEVTAATTASSPSTHRIKTGRFLEPLPLVKGMSATHNSPGRIGIVQSFVFRSVTVEKGGMTVYLRRANRLERETPTARSDRSYQRLRQTQRLARLQFDLVGQLDQFVFHCSSLPALRFVP